VPVELEDEKEPGGQHTAPVVVGHDGRLVVDAEPSEQGGCRLGADREALGVGGRVVELTRVDEGRARHVTDPVGDPAGHPAPEIDDPHARRREHPRQLLGLDQEPGIRIPSAGATRRGHAEDGGDDDGHGSGEKGGAGRQRAWHSGPPEASAGAPARRRSHSITEP
jgi:hypothetical protein